ncbi:MAG: hypothetical protein ACYSU7_20085 [Planctomycetota bacterium]
MREHIRRMIKEARRPVPGLAIDKGRDPALRLASETIRLARLAVSTHMVLAARASHQVPGEPAEPTAVRGQTR